MAMFNGVEVTFNSAYDNIPGFADYRKAMEMQSDRPYEVGDRIEFRNSGESSMGTVKGTHELGGMTLPIVQWDNPTQQQHWVAAPETMQYLHRINVQKDIDMAVDSVLDQLIKEVENEQSVPETVSTEEGLAKSSEPSGKAGTKAPSRSNKSRTASDKQSTKTVEKGQG